MHLVSFDAAPGEGSEVAPAAGDMIPHGMAVRDIPGVYKFQIGQVAQ